MPKTFYRQDAKGGQLYLLELKTGILFFFEC
jgi:hypothetical protein